MAKVSKSIVRGGCRYRIVDDGANVSYRDLFDRLAGDTGFTDWYSELLAAFDSEAFYWEFPPLTSSTVDDSSEFVLINAPALARLAPEPGPFATHFASAGGQDVVVFPNLGGDAVLVAPVPLGPAEAYPHLAAFLHLAPTDQVRSLWRATARTMLERLGDRPVWLSTAGGGVAWLHVRLDSRPKYYSYRPYAEASGDRRG